MNNMNLFLLFQESSEFLDTLFKYHNYVYMVVIFVSIIVLLRYNIPARLASGWQKVSGLQDKELDISEKEVKSLKDQKLKDDAEIIRLVAQIVDLTREVDVRREINRQDSKNIKILKLEVGSSEQIISRLRNELRIFNDGK